MSLTLNRGREAREWLRHRLFGVLEDTNKFTSMCFIFIGEERQRLTRLAAPSSTANTVDIILNCKWEGVVHNVLHVWNVEAASGNI